MTRGIFIAGNESTLFTAAAKEAAKRVSFFVSAHIPNRFTPLPLTEPQSTENNEYLKWNPSSAISARTLILAAENRLKKIDDAILICSPPAVFKNPETLTPQEIEILVDDHIKGWFFLIRELIIYFRKSGSGLLTLITQGDSPEAEKKRKNDKNNTQLDILGPSAYASFYNFSQGIMKTQENEPYKVMGFTGTEPGTEEAFAAWFFKIVDEAAPKNTGCWHKYKKKGIF